MGYQGWPCWPPMEEPAVFISAVVHIYSQLAHVIRFFQTRLLILLRLLWMTTVVWDANVVQHFFHLVRTSADCYRRILLNTFISFFDEVSCCLIRYDI